MNELIAMYLPTTIFYYRYIGLFSVSNRRGYERTSLVWEKLTALYKRFKK